MSSVIASFLQQQDSCTIVWFALLYRWVMQNIICEVNMITAATATVTSRGQVTLPRAVREAIGDSKTIEFTVVDNVITLQPIPDMASSLAKYAKGKPDSSLSEIREQVWTKVAHDKAS
jgi:bifunctional DNA-binding transcriptional regulator/antitoxin component of YhaV-PrlF toxin-antitoxin module